MKIRYILLIIVVALTVTGFSCNNNKAEKVLRANAQIELPKPLNTKYKYVTPKGVLVGGNFEVTPTDRVQFFADIDAGIERTLQVTERLGYKEFRLYQQYTVVYEKPMSYSADTNCPTLNLKNGQKIAGIVIGVGTLILEPPFIYIAYENKQTSNECREFRKNAVSYEAEHIQAWYNDRDLFWQKTGANDVHPIYTDSVSKPVKQSMLPKGKEVFLWKKEREEIRKGVK